MNLEESLSSWKGLLSKCFTDLQSLYPNLNESDIARKIDIPRATLNRIKNGGKLPRLDNIIKLIVGSGNSDLLSKAIALVDQGLGEKVQSALSVTMKEKNKVLADFELEKLLDDRDVFVAYLLCDLPSGTDKIQLVEVLGNNGLEAIKALVSKNVAFEKEERFFLNKSGSLVRSFESIKRHLPTYARFYKTEHVGQGRNYVHSLSNGLNEKGLSRLQEAHRKFHAEIQSIQRDPELQGNEPAFSVAFCDTFTLNTQNPTEGGLQ